MKYNLNFVDILSGVWAVCVSIILIALSFWIVVNIIDSLVS